MPLTEILCAAPKYRRKHEDHPVTLAACLSCAHTRENSCHFTYELLSSMFAQQQDRGSRITTTTLTSSCLRSEYLKRTEPFAEQPEKMWASFRGTMYHGQLEQHSAPGSIEEGRYHVDLPHGHLSGSPDLVDIRMGILYDYKVTKEVPKFSYPWGSHTEQNNVNRWLVDNAEWVDYRGVVYLLHPDALERAREYAEAHEMNVVTDILENTTEFRPVVWNELVVVYMDDKGPKPISCTRSEKVPTSDGRGEKSVRVPDIWTDERVEAYIEERYLAAKSALHDDVLPEIPEGWEDLAHPLCGWCPKRKECLEHHIAAGVQDLQVEQAA